MSTPKYPKLTAKQRKGLDSLNGPDDESVPSVRRTDKRNPVRTNPKDSGRKGGERRQEKLQDEIHLGPDVMIAALNLVRYRAVESSEGGYPRYRVGALPRAVPHAGLVSLRLTRRRRQGPRRLVAANSRCRDDPGRGWFHAPGSRSAFDLCETICRQLHRHHDRIRARF